MEQLIQKYKSILSQLNINENLVEKVANLSAKKEDELLNTLPFQSTEKITHYIIEDVLAILGYRKWQITKK